MVTEDYPEGGRGGRGGTGREEGGRGSIHVNKRNNLLLLIMLLTSITVQGVNFEAQNFFVIEQFSLFYKLKFHNWQAKIYLHKILVSSHTQPLCK